jgi:hypothetical protein
VSRASTASRCSYPPATPRSPSLVASTARLVPALIPGFVLGWLSYALALGLAARAVGEFKYVGFFKRVRGSKFARLDTLVYSPLCLLLAIGVAAVAHAMQGQA